MEINSVEDIKKLMENNKELLPKSMILMEDGIAINNKCIEFIEKHGNCNDCKDNTWTTDLKGKCCFPLKGIGSMTEKYLLYEDDEENKEI